MKFTEFLNDVHIDESVINEVLITLGKQAYPKFGNVVILAGGAGSGKGFVKDKLLGLEGKSLDVDQLKTLAMKSPKINKKVMEDYGVSIKDFDLSVPDNVSYLHRIIEDLKVGKKHTQSLYSSILSSKPERKPNLIFDVTLKNITKLHNIAKDIQSLGYMKENIHIVWVVNDVEIAISQNKERERVVPEDILIDTHEGASLTMKKLIDMGDGIKKYLNGSIVLAFNKKKVDSEITTSKNGGIYIRKSNYIVVKEKGKSIDTSKISDDILRKIQSYVPDVKTWND